MISTEEIACPFCTGHFRVVLAEEAPRVEHSLPACEKFEVLGVIEFTMAAWQAMGLPATAEDAN